MIFGWSHPEPEGRWTDGPRASLALEWLGYDDSAIEVGLVGRMFAAALDPDQGLTVSANGTASPLRFETLGPEHVEASLRPRPIRTDRGSVLNLDLSISRPTSPLSRGLSDDTRALGFRLERLRLQRADVGGGGSKTTADGSVSADFWSRLREKLAR